ncbi:MAG: sulfatase-like hydrolase/transferase [Acetobacteraceae bacterium]|nr:sulfatase-like hydrolase/transferase [Acetobacteraceae bacterium]
MKNRTEHFAAGAIMSFVLFVLPPVSVHAPNASEFGGSAWQLLWPFLVLFVIGTIITAVIAHLASFRPILLVLYLSTSIAALVTSQILSGSHKIVLDGGVHAYRASTFAAAGEIVLLGGIFVLALVLRRQIYANRRFVTAVISLWALLAAAVPSLAYLSSRQIDRTSRLEPLARLSSKLNVLHVMFDSLQSDAFMEILERDPSLRQEFEGFVLYKEHSGYSNWTSISIPALLAGHLYFDEHTDKTETAQDIIRRWTTEESLMARLAARGFDVSAMQPGRFLCEGASYPCTTLEVNFDQLKQWAKNTPALKLNDDSRLFTGEQALLADLSLLRLSPSIVKAAIYNDGRFLLSQGRVASVDDLTPIQKDVVLSVGFASYLGKNFTAVGETPAYKFIHIFPPHKPFVLGKDCGLQRASLARGGAEETWDNYLEQAHCAIRLFVGLLRKLKELGIYDNTVIVLQADTGLGMSPGAEKRPEEPIVSELGNYTVSNLIGYAQPVFAIKQLAARGPLATSNELTHHRDTIPMVMSAISGVETQPSSSFRSKPGTRQQPRPFVVSGILRPGVRRITPFELFEITGPLRDFENWTFKGQFKAPGELAQPLREIDSVLLEVTPKGKISIGDTITLSAMVSGGEPDLLYLFFHRTGEGKLGLIQNWSFRSEARWTVGETHRNRCVLELLVAVRNEGSPEKNNKSFELAVPLKRPGCP